MTVEQDMFRYRDVIYL